MTGGTDTAIEALTTALEQLEAGTAVHDHVREAHRTLTTRRPPSPVQAYLAIERVILSVDVQSPVHDQLMAAWAAVRPSRAAIPIAMVAAYVVQQRVRADEADQRGEAAFSPIPGARERASQLSFVDSCLGMAEEAGVGAVLGPAIDNAMLDQLELLREQLHWQKEINTVPHTLTEDAVTPFYRDSITGVGRGDLSADQAVWIRHQIGKIGKRK